MTAQNRPTRTSPIAGKIPPDTTGLPGQDEEHVTYAEVVGRRPLSMAWISNDLLAETIEVWSEAYDRPVSEDEAVEILMNVKRLGEVLWQARMEMNAS